MQEPARSFADDIRARSDSDLATLLLLRPDLARPAPADVSGVAARAGTLASTARAIDALDRRQLSLLEAAVLLRPPVTVDGLQTLLGGVLDPAELEDALDDLWRRGLLWQDEEGPRPVSAVVDTLGPYPAGLGPPAADVGATTLGADELSGAPPEVHAVLGALTWGPPVAEQPAAGPRTRTADAIRWLAEHDALGATEAGALIVPRELGLSLREGRSHRSADLRSPVPVSAAAPLREQVNAAAGSAAAELIAHCEELLVLLAADPAPVLKGGGLSVRELRTLARSVDVDLPHAAYLVELLVGAELVADDGELEPHFVPTADYDAWRQAPPAQQWARLAWAWWTSTRTLHLLPASGTGTLGAELTWPPIRALRQDVVRQFAAAADRALTAPDVEAALRFARPRRLPRDLRAVVDVTLAESGRLGVIGLGSLSDAGRRLPAANAADDLDNAIHPHLPTPVDHVILQGDLTAVAPGPLIGPLADIMRLCSDVESRGGATVHRFSPASVTRALDRGWTADELIDALTSGSPTPMPQALDYLIRDEARRHGQVRIGAAETYLRTDDPARLAELLNRSDLALLRLSQIAPTVLVSPVEPSVVHDVLRDAGVGGAAETPTGETVPRQRRERRTATRSTRRVTHTTLTPEETGEIVRQLRAGEAASQARPQAGRSALPYTDPTTALVILREAAAEQIPVWIGYAGGSGQIERILFHPELAEGGRVVGTAKGVRRTLSIHRITGAAPA
ncbi:MAG: helicase-associated domain-containing protein [Intrasporangiaceae bacterium]|nr:helicase-associated domain-containing protein [Intrasporangiaceae bacterium]